MALDGAGHLSQFVQLDVAHFTGMRLDSSLNFKGFSGFLRSSRIDFVYEPFLNFPTTSWILPIRSSSFKITSCAIPSILRSTSNHALSRQLTHLSAPVSWNKMSLGHLSGCLDPLSALFPFSAPVAWCEKTHSQRCLVAAAAAIAKHS